MQGACIKWFLLLRSVISDFQFLRKNQFQRKLHLPWKFCDGNAVSWFCPKVIWTTLWRSSSQILESWKIIFDFMLRIPSSDQDDASQCFTIQVACIDGSLQKSRDITWEASPNPSIVGICMLRARRSVASNGFTEHWVSDPFDTILVRGPCWGWWPYEYVAAEESKGYTVCGKGPRDWSIWNCKGIWLELNPHKRTDGSTNKNN